MRTIALALTFLGVISVSAKAQAPLEASKTAGVRIVAQDRVARSGTRAVRVAGQGTMRVGVIADRLFVKPRALAANLEKAKAALVGEPTVDERFVETEHATLFVSTTKMTVKDPAALRGKVPELRSYQAKVGAPLTTADLKGPAKQGFEAFKTTLASAPSNHPLKLALAKGDDALLAAIGRGEGDVTVTITASIPKEALPTKNGGLQKPRIIEGAFSPTATDAFPTKLLPTSLAAMPAGVVAVGSTDTDPGPPGKKKFTASFVTGFTEGDEFDWEERWDFPSGFFSVGIGAYYAFGLRVPLEVTATLDTVEITKLGSPDTTAVATTTVSAKAIDGDKSFYQAAGMDSDDVHDGHELVLDAGAYATVRVEAGWGAIKVNETFPKNLSFDYSKDFTPPFGDCGTHCGFDVWIPATITHTGISVLGIVEGSAQIGFNVSGKGTIGVDYTSLFDGREIESQGASKAKTQHLELTSTAATTLRTTLPALPKAFTEEYGYRLSAPTFDWSVTVTPGVKGTVAVNARPFFSLEETIGPFWLPFLDIDLGTVHLKAHKGTNHNYSEQPGRKSLKVLQAAPIGTLPPGAIKPH